VIFCSRELYVKRDQHLLDLDFLSFRFPRYFRTLFFPRGVLVDYQDLVVFLRHQVQSERLEGRNSDSIRAAANSVCSIGKIPVKRYVRRRAVRRGVFPDRAVRNFVEI